MAHAVDDATNKVIGVARHTALVGKKKLAVMMVEREEGGMKTDDDECFKTPPSSSSSSCTMGRGSSGNKNPVLLAHMCPRDQML